MKIKLSDHFTYPRLLKFVLPSISMMIFTSIYTMVDGLFVSNFAGKIPFAAINLAYPIVISYGCFGFMIGTGGSALVSKTLGQGNHELANRYFSMIIFLTIFIGGFLSIFGLVTLRQFVIWLGASGQMLEHALVYGRILISFNIFYMMQNVFQSLLVTAERPKLGLYVTMLAGLINIVLDYLFVGVLKGGVYGASFATVIAQVVGALIPIIYFLSKKNNSILHFAKPKFELHAMIKVCTNGASELVGNISAAIVNMLYNFWLLKLAGENGVSAFGVVMYVAFLFNAIFFGYVMGASPIISYHYGAKNETELKNLFKKSIRIILSFGLVMFFVSEFSAGILSKIFVGYDEGLYQMTSHAFKVFGLTFLVAGINIFASSFFTALNDGFVSALISFLRLFVFQVASVMILPVIFGLEGVWYSYPLSEILALSVTLTMFIKMRYKYHYL